MLTFTEAVVLSALGGLVLGSFLNVVAYRLPRRESLMSPPSHCRACDKPIRAYDNVPVISWLVLRGRCRDCDARISARYPIVEAATAGLFALIVATRFHHLSQTVLGLIFVAFLVPLTLIDLDVRRLPNVLVLPAGALAVIVGTALDPGGEVARLLAGLACGAAFSLIVFIYPGGMGLGDAKLATAMGLFLGSEVSVALIVALVSGTALGLALIARRGLEAGRKTAIPFGPFLALGSVVAIAIGPQLVHLYLTRSW